MSRPLRIEYEGALYHVTARGNSGQYVFSDDIDRNKFLDFFAQEVALQRWICHTYCLMGTHWHLLLETPEPNLSRGMCRLNGRYSQWFNARHHRHGHLLQGRYKAILVEKESYLLELCRYVVLNPVRAGMVDQVEQWSWSSYQATVGSQACPVWLTIDWLLSLFANSKKPAQAAYCSFVADGIRKAPPWHALRGQVFLGSQDFLHEMTARIEAKAADSEQIPKTTRRPGRPGPAQVIARVAQEFGLPIDNVFDRKRHAAAFRLLTYLLRRVCNLPLKDVAAMVGVSTARVSQIQKLFDGPRAPHFLAPTVAAMLKKYKF